MSKTRLMTVATVALSGVLLSGCGNLAPGVGVQVGDQELSLRDLDTATANLCAAREDQSAGQAQATPMAEVRDIVTQSLTLRSWALQVGEEQGVKPGKTYLSERAQTERVAVNLPKDTRDTYLDVATVEALVVDIIDQIGRQSLTDSGVTEPTTDEVRQAGADLFRQWPNTHEIKFDPRYGLKMVDGALAPVDTHTSVAVGELAQAGLLDKPDAEYVQSLPVALRCG